MTALRLRCLLLSAFLLLAASGQAADPADWPTYNHDALGSRHNPAETALRPDTVGGLTEKWRFPAADEDLRIGVIHATPSVVGGQVYFGTATDACFYKLSADGKLLWNYRNPKRAATKPAKKSTNTIIDKLRFQSQAEGIMTSALVTADSVYFGDLSGWFYCLDRETGRERWKVHSRDASFPGAHDSNVWFGSPIEADGRIIASGGALEQLYAGSLFYKGSTGRGFVAAFEPQTGKLLWKHDVGPKPEKLEPPITIEDTWGKHTFDHGPATSSVWSTPSFDAETGTVFFGTDVNTAPRKPTDDDPQLHTPESCAVIAIDVRDGSRKWVRQLNPGDVWTNSMRGWDPKTGLYKDQSIGDTPKIYTLEINGRPVKVVGVGCKNGGFYVLRADDGQIVAETPRYTGPPTYPLSPTPDPRVLALPSPIGGLQTGCATDGRRVYTNGIDALLLASQAKITDGKPPTGGRVVSISADLAHEHWRHERPQIPSLGGPPPKAVFKNLGDPVASGLAVAGGVVYFTTVASGKLVAVDAESGKLLKEIELGPVWSGPSVSRGRVYIGTGNTLFSPADYEAFFPKAESGSLHCFGLPGE
ncbi:MAG: PQQ-binding-like beta-propeller repeat protein [Pirellulales bacterium]